MCGKSHAQSAAACPRRHVASRRALLRILSWALVTLSCMTVHARAETNDQRQLADIVVSAAPLPSTPSQLGRAVEIVRRDSILGSGVSSVPEALERLTTASVFERGDHPVQADLSIRGSTFQQVLLTIDGLPATDPQTAHHNMNMPFPLGAAETIDVIPGPGSALFGPGALAGTVNVQTRIPQEPGFWLSRSYGDFKTYRTDAVLDVVKNNVASTLAAAYATSHGFMDGTDYTYWSGWSSSFLGNRENGMRISAGYATRDFGAQDFYGSYPSHEITSSTLVDMAPQIRIASDWQMNGIVRFRQHDDDFILFKDDPSIYRNRNSSQTFIERISLLSPSYAFGTVAAGVERTDSAIDSSNLGDHHAFINSAFLQYRLFHEKRWNVDVGLRADALSRWGTEISPSLSASVVAADGVTFRAAGGRAIRPPSFTELHYTDPENIGNPELAPEEAWGAEVGIDLALPHDMSFSSTFFFRDSEDLIDWVRPSTNDPWQAENIGHAVAYGPEIALSGRLGLLGWRTSYRHIDTDADSGGLQSKYALNAARHEAGMNLSFPETHGFSACLGARYRDVPTLDRYWLIGARIAQHVGAVKVFAQGKNLLNEEYEEIPGVPTAGRYIEAGIELDW